MDLAKVYGSGLKGSEAVSKLDKLWAALEAYEPQPIYAHAWATMLQERTLAAVNAIYKIAPKDSEMETVVASTLWAISSDMLVDRYAQQAIDAIKEVKP